MSHARTNTRPIIMLNPGRRSRHYMLGILRAAQSLGLNPGSIEIGPIREQVARVAQGVASLDSVLERLRSTIEIGGFTDIITYANVGGPELGIWHTEQGMGSVWNALGLRQHIVWTDHPQWAADGAALHPDAQNALSHPAVFHRLKSEQAAHEASDMLRWSHIEALPVAEDYGMLTPSKKYPPRHDVVAIIGSVSPLPEKLTPYLDQPDPDPSDMDRVLIPQTIKQVRRFAVQSDETPRDLDGFMRLSADLLEARAAQPFSSVWEHAQMLRRVHPEAVNWLCATPRRWYEAQARFRQASAWRRSFWLAWVARRIDLGVYGCDASVLGIPQSDTAKAWVPYKQQPAIYASGRCAININQSHDETGVTHKPFQIVASGVPLVHHAVSGLTNLFDPQNEIRIFSRGPELLHAIDEICAHETRRTALAAKALRRATQEHAWTNRVAHMFNLNAAMNLDRVAA